jgi:hypothetical protein
MQNKINQYMDSVYTQQNRLVGFNADLSSFDGIRALDIPPGITGTSLSAWYGNIQKFGYGGVNVGLTSLWRRVDPSRLSAIAKMHILSAHGTSVKWQLKEKKQYRVALE